MITLRRYYLLKRIAAERQGEDGLAAGWKYKQETIPWPDLPAGFPARVRLMESGYTTVRDLDGATETELRLNARLSKTEITAVQAAMENWIMIAKQQSALTYTEQNGKYVEQYDAPLHESATRTASGTGDTYEMGAQTTMRMLLSVTAASGTTPTLDVVVETSHDGSTGWVPLFTFGQKTTTGSDRVSFSGADRFVRCKYTLGGTAPSFTFSLTGESL